MKLNLVQYSPIWENKEENKSKILSLLVEECNNSIIIFPEMTLTGFTMSMKHNAEELSGNSFRFFSEIAKRCKSEVLAGIIEVSSGKYFNALLSINSKGDLKSVYRKIHPFSFSGEDKYYTAGNSPVTSEISGVKTGLSICYDLRFPELFRLYGKERVSLIVNMANWPDTRIEHWRTLLKARSIENQCYVAGVNRTGSDPKLVYPGFSSVFDPLGKEIAVLEEKEGVLTAEIEIEYVEEVRRKLPFLKDMVLL